jgi:hypothetical protein
VKSKKYEHGRRLKVTIYITLYGDNSRNVALRQMKFGTDHGRTYKFYFTAVIVLSDEVFKHGDDAKF